ncbi:vomeronasal type-2 receptor 26-like [Gastrophryne carolinensis]
MDIRKFGSAMTPFKSEQLLIPDFEEYRSILVFIFAVNEINKNLNLLPNITLGYHIYSTCTDTKKTIKYLLHILSGRRREAPNYNCKKHGEVAGFIGESILKTTQAMAQLLSFYRYTHVSFSVTEPSLGNQQMYPTFYRTVQNDLVRYASIINLLLLYEWNFVGMIKSRDNSGETEFREISKILTQNGICIEYVIEFPDIDEDYERRAQVIERSVSRVIIICGEFDMFYIPFLNHTKAIHENMTLLLHGSWIYVKGVNPEYFKSFNCSFLFQWPEKMVPVVRGYLDIINQSNPHNNPILEDISLLFYNYSSRNRRKNAIFRLMNNETYSQSKLERKFIYEPLSRHYHVYTAVYAMAHALHMMNLHKNGTYRFRNRLHHYMKRVHFQDNEIHNISFNERRESSSAIAVHNWIFYQDFKKLSNLKLVGICMEMGDGRFNCSWRKHLIIWKHGSAPQSQCNDKCTPGYHKASKEGIHACCYSCVLCSEGEISNTTDSEICHKCPDEEWPDIRRIVCIPKDYEFLSYEHGGLALAFSVISLLFCGIILFILGIFILNRDKPIVKANNWIVSIILLTSILLSFLCVFLFLGRPVDITCILRQILFGIFFSTALSCVLAKTVTVCIAFKATKPNSSWRKWVGTTISNFTILVCSAVQVLICVVWLSVSPPYQEYDMSSYSGKIIIQCNEGSGIGFYSVLGYMGFLAAVSFVLAFMVRTLPDSFNEAKYITFSMLVFCSVWIAMIPAYLSTRGKYMVAVEVFAILASNAGILACIFFPKLYILFLKPDLNSRKCILQNNNS